MTRFDALAFVCRCITPETRDEQLLREDIAGGQIDWKQVVEVASDYFVISAIYWALNRKKNLSEALPTDVHDYFIGAYELNTGRNQQLRDQTIEVCKALNSAGVMPLVLKGVANMLEGLYESPGIRIMLDIDLLIPEGKMERCVKALRDAGYEEVSSAGRPYSHHHPPMIHKNRIAAVELHKELTLIVGKKDSLTEKMWTGSQTRIVDGARLLVPTPQMRVLHNIVHVVTHHTSYDIQHIQQMFDFACLRHSHEKEIDWLSIEENLKAIKKLQAFRSYLEVNENLFGQPVPSVIKHSTAKLIKGLTVFRLQVNYSLVRQAYFMFDNYYSLLYFVIRHSVAREDFFKKLLNPRFYPKHMAYIIGKMKSMYK